MSVAYVILSHAHPEMIERLVGRLLAGDPSCHVLVEHQAGGPRLALGPDDRLRVRTSPRPGGWGGFGLVASTLEALRDVHERLDPDWVVLLSGQDYPALPPDAVRELLERSADDALLDLWRVVGPARRGGRDAVWWNARYFMRWYRLPAIPLRLPSALTRVRHGLQRRLSFAQPFVFLWSLPRAAGTRIGFRRLRVPFGPGFECQAGSQWFALGRPALASVLAQVDRRPELIGYYRRTVIPDESFFNTLVANDPRLRVRRTNLTFFRPDGEGTAHAGVLDLDDLAAIIASGRPFVRKVEPVRSASLLDALDRRADLSG